MCVCILVMGCFITFRWMGVDLNFEYEPHMRKSVMSFANNRGMLQCSFASAFIICGLDSTVPLVSISEFSS